MDRPDEFLTGRKDPPVELTDDYGALELGEGCLDLEEGWLTNVEPEEDEIEVEPEPAPPEPSLDTTPEEVVEYEWFYPVRSPNDVVVSGPITGGWGPGRWFKNRRMALTWAMNKYGKDRISLTRQTVGRWSILVRGLKNANAAN